MAVNSKNHSYPALAYSTEAIGHFEGQHIRSLGCANTNLEKRRPASSSREPPTQVTASGVTCTDWYLLRRHALLIRRLRRGVSAMAEFGRNSLVWELDAFREQIRWGTP